ncbi:hypothetical protein GCM10009111_00280 [Colwellia asteriadis]|uniref:ASP external chaperone domain-containing protein n=1 Tax=Colwellia asteriadis TaxID=517723 RepID=A0ABN1L1Z6_9GAMM
MKFNKIALLTASVLLSTSVIAQVNADRDLLTPTSSTTKHTVQKADFGSYKVERNLAYIPTSVASSDIVIATKGSMALVNASSPVTNVTKGTLVRNTLTNEVSPLSGNISVLLKPGVSAGDVSSETGLTLVSAYAGTKIAVFKVTGSQDLIEESKKLKASGLVKVARIEVLEVMHKEE